MPEPPPSANPPGGVPPGAEPPGPKGRIAWQDSPLATGTARTIPVPAGGMAAVKRDATADYSAETMAQRSRTQIMLEPMRDPGVPVSAQATTPAIARSPVPALDDPAATVPPLSPDGLGADLESPPAGDASPFDHAPPFGSGYRSLRNPARLWTIAALVFAAALLALAAAVYSFGLPDWLPHPHPGGGEAHADLRLSFPQARQERRTLPGGADYFGASGTITNVGRTAQRVPALRLVLRDGYDKIVYQWDIAPPRRDLAPGESMTINDARTDVPRSARFADIGWKPE